MRKSHTFVIRFCAFLHLNAVPTSDKKKPPTDMKWSPKIPPPQVISIFSEEDINILSLTWHEPKRRKRETGMRKWNVNLPYLKLTWHLKIDGWNTSFLLGWSIFRCYVSLMEGFWFRSPPQSEFAKGNRFRMELGPARPCFPPEAWAEQTSAFTLMVFEINKTNKGLNHQKYPEVLNHQVFSYRTLASSY